MAKDEVAERSAATAVNFSVHTLNQSNGGGNTARNRGQDLSQQFVEAVLVIKANSQYPVVPPELELIDSKGLDDKRHSDLLLEIQHEAEMLASSPMLVALCEAAIDKLSNMNHPEGNCSFCLFPLVMEDTQSALRPFMKLMSCFHCFHSDCFGRWWRWLQEQNQHEQCKSADTTLSGLTENADEIYSRLPYSSEASKFEECQLVNCPVCRKVIHAKDVDHLRQFLTSGLDLQENDEGSIIDNILSTEAENKRREQFEQMFNVQKQCGGIIEPKKLVILPGMFLPGSALASVESIDSDNEEIVPVQDINMGRGSAETATGCSDLPSSSTSPTSYVETEEASHVMAGKHLDANSKRPNFGKRGQNNLRRSDNQQNSHRQKQHSRRQTGALPSTTCWIKKE
ncbi:hypothetical protein SUGI_0582620 [Cryptomeria japonica]|nr:hypothetical protein SUGI_0582620 [Cryptomeria japonica]